ncbi:MAG: beta-ketoacyl-ACP synthase III [Planctomycetota bacterium]|nr:beta-ketoacyl-ACP synthase III [Planctomycetota bacterium]
MTIRVGVAGIGSYVPERTVTNHDLEKVVDTSDAWIVQRTGIRERRIASDDQCSSDLATEASRMALEDAGVDASEIGLVIVATATPDQQFPATALRVIENLGCENAGGWDLSAACSGFVFAVQAAAQYIRTGSMGAVLVIGVETLSRIMNYEDRTTCILFGDGAGAVVLTPHDRTDGGMEYLAAYMGSAPDRDAIIQPGGGSRIPASHESVDSGAHFLQMDGRRTFKFAVRTFADLVRRSVADHGGASELGIVVPHQMNQRIIEAAADRLELPIELFFSNVASFGNTSAASIPIAMRDAKEAGRFAAVRGKLACMCAFGSGLSFGYFLLRV